jgi:hypothetical protein
MGKMQSALSQYLGTWEVTERYVYSMESHNCLMKEQENKFMYDHNIKTRVSGSTNCMHLKGNQQLQGLLPYAVNKLLVLPMRTDVKWVQTYSGT